MITTSRLEQSDIQAIAKEVADIILPILQDMHRPDRLMNIDEASMLLGKSKGQIYQWVDRAKHGLSDFPYQKAGRSLRFSEKDILKWMECNKRR